MMAASGGCQRARGAGVHWHVERRDGNEATASTRETYSALENCYRELGRTHTTAGTSSHLSRAAPSMLTREASFSSTTSCSCSCVTISAINILMPYVYR